MSLQKVIKQNPNQIVTTFFDIFNFSDPNNDGKI